MSEAQIKAILAKRKKAKIIADDAKDLRNSSVIETRTKNGGLTLMRRRECNTTGIRYNTIETRLNQYE